MIHLQFYYRDQTWFSCINIRQVPREVLKTEAGGRGFQHLPRDLANVNALKNHVRSLLLHKNWKHLLHFALFLALFCFAFSPISRKRNFHGLCSFYGRDVCGTGVRASISKPTPFIYLAFEKTDPFHILDSLKCWPIHILPVDFYTHSYWSYSSMFAYMFTNKKIQLYHPVLWYALALTQLSNPVIPTGLIYPYHFDESILWKDGPFIY